MERYKLWKNSNGYSRIQYKENQDEKNPLKYRVKNIEKKWKNLENCRITCLKLCIIRLLEGEMREKKKIIFN